MNTAVISMRLNDSEQRLFGKAAKFYGVSVPKFIKSVARREAEDAIDIAMAAEAYARYLKDPSSFKKWEDIEAEFLPKAKR